MALPHAQSGQVIDVGPLGGRLAQEKSVALFKSADLELMRLVLPAGKSLHEHHVPGDITIHCVEGEIEITTVGAAAVLQAGQLLYLARGVVHGVRALRDSSALLTVALRP